MSLPHLVASCPCSDTGSTVRNNLLYPVLQGEFLISNVPCAAFGLLYTSSAIESILGLSGVEANTIVSNYMSSHLSRSLKLQYSKILSM